MFIGYVFMTAFGVSLLLYRYVMAINISAWASALLVLTGWAMRRPQSVGRVTVTDSRAFYLCLFESKNEEANRIVQSVAQSLGLSKDDMASIVLNSIMIRNRRLTRLCMVCRKYKVRIWFLNFTQKG